MISAHRKEADPVKRAAYLELAGPAIEAAGGRFLAKGGRVQARENGLAGRTILIEFDSYEAAVAAYDSKLYKEALRALEGGADRNIRLFEGVEWQPYGISTDFKLLNFIGRAKQHQTDYILLNLET